MSVCKGCGAEIEWAISEKNHKPIPIDPTPSDAGNLIVALLGGRDGKTKIVRVVAGPSFLHDGPFYMPHHATCPNAEDFRA